LRRNAAALIGGERADFALTAAEAGPIYCVPIRSELAGLAELARSIVLSPAPSMIILSKLADYGVIVATHFAAYPERQATAAAIAAATRLPPATVAKLLKALAHAGLVTATRGPAGGYRLARLPAAISVAEVVAAIDGDIGVTQCSVHVADCDRTNYCPTRPHWAAINRAVGAALSAVSLDEMIGPMAFAPSLPVFAEPATGNARILMDQTPR
jgi:FeS assembly SUF system regulator